jgi:predicted ATPase
MEQLATPGTIRLTAETVRLAEGFVRVWPLGPIPVRALAEPVEAFELAGAEAARTRLDAARARGLTPFVGRAAEMEEIRRAAEQAARGQGQIIAVVGEPGVGKSRLFDEFTRVQRAQGWLVLEARAAAYGRATPFFPLADALRRYFGIDGRDDGASVRARITSTLRSLDRGLEDAVPAVAWLLDALDPGDGFLGLDPARRRQLAVEGVKRVVLQESRVQPVLLVFEDLHWIDPETQSVLDGLVDGLPAARVLLAVNYRPEYGHQWGGRSYYRQLRVDSLPPESAAELLGTLLGSDPSVGPVKPLLIERTEGNPLFLEESVRALVETDALVGDAGAYRLAKAPQAVQVPASVQAILAARIDRLPPGLKRLLHAAAVVGKDVPVSLLEAVGEMRGDELRQALHELQAAEFLYEVRVFPDPEYTFKHALTHEVAYGGVLQERRRALHVAIVEAIERLYAGRLAEQVERLADHAVRGRALDKAVRYLHQAGTRAVARSAVREAIRFFEQGLAILQERPETPETLAQALAIHMELGPALMAVRGAGAAEVEAAYLRARDLAEQVGDASRRFPALWGLWFFNYNRGRYAAALAAGRELLAAAEAEGDSGMLLEAHHALWPTLLAGGQARAALPHMARGLALYQRERHASQAALYGGHDAGACCRYQLALAQMLLGETDRALATLADALQLAAELDHPLTMTITLWFACCIHYQRGDDKAVATHAERLASLTQDYGFTTWADVAIVGPLMGRGARLGADALADVHRRLLAVRGGSWRHVFCLCALAELYADAGLGDEGRRILDSIEPADRVAFYAPEIHRIEGELLLRRPEPATAEAEGRFIAACDLARERGERALELRAALSLATLRHATGRPDEARRALVEAGVPERSSSDSGDAKAAHALLRRIDGADAR